MAKYQFNIVQLAQKANSQIALFKPNTEYNRGVSVSGDPATIVRYMFCRKGVILLKKNIQFERANNIKVISSGPDNYTLYRIMRFYNLFFTEIDVCDESITVIEIDDAIIAPVGQKNESLDSRLESELECENLELGILLLSFADRFGIEFNKIEKHHVLLKINNFFANIPKAANPRRLCEYLTKNGIICKVATKRNYRLESR